MRRLQLLVAIALVTTGMAVAVAPAQAHPQTCSGQGTMTTPPMFYAGTGPDANGGWSLTLTVGTCIPLSGMTAAGTISGNCNLASGTGSVNGHSFSFTWVNGHMVWAGQAVGEWQAVPDILSAQSCLTGATRWIVTGWVNMI